MGAGKLLLTSGVEGTRDECLTRIIKRIEEDVKYYSELFDEPTSQLILKRIETMGLPNNLAALGAQLLDHTAELLGLAMTTLRAIASSVTEQRMKAIRATAAQKTINLVDRVRSSLRPLRSSLFRARAELLAQYDQLLALIDECTQQVAPHLPSQADEDSDDEYF